MIESERRFPVSRDTLFRAFADPAVLAAWWGPHGSVNTFDTFDLRPGGIWRFTMRVADGQEYAMTHEFLEVVPPERVVFRHVQEGHEFELRMHFDAVEESQTLLRWRMQFADPEEAARVRPHVVRANEENFDRLESALGLPLSEARATRTFPR